MICEHKKLGSESGNIEEGRFLNEWKDYLDQHKSLKTLRDMIMNKNNSSSYLMQSVNILCVT